MLFSVLSFIGNVLKWKNQGIITVSGLDERNDIVGNDALDRAYELGYKL